MFVNWLRESLQRFLLLRKLAWRVHVLMDWWGTRVWTRTTEVLTPLGFKLTAGVHPAYRQMQDGRFEVAETALLAKLLEHVDRFIDVGANLGFYTCLALKSGKPVVAVEPQQQNLNSLYRNLRANGWEAEVFPLALAEQPGLLVLYGASGPSASLVKGWAGYASRHQTTVPVSTLDVVAGRRFAGEQLLIKIDVEGAERQVLGGAVDTIGLVPKPVWLIEICLDEFHPEGANPAFREIFQLFWRNGYEAYTATLPPRRVTPDDIERWWRNQNSDVDAFNYVFVEAARASLVAG